MTARVVAVGVGRPFVGLCRAKHAVVEASILASRLRWLPRTEVQTEVDRLSVLVEKTGGPGDREAMVWIRDYIAGRPASGRGGA